MAKKNVIFLLEVDENARPTKRTLTKLRKMSFGERFEAMQRLARERQRKRK